MTTAREWVTATVVTGLLTAGGIGLGYYAGTHAPTGTTQATTQDYADERTQDPTGIPYCDPADPLYACIDLAAMGYLDVWGDDTLILADRYAGPEGEGIALFECDSQAQDCRFIEPGSVVGLYDSTPNVDMP